MIPSANRRTFTLSNKQVVWDLAGNVWERMKDDNDQNYGTDRVRISLITAVSHPVLRALSRGTTTTPRNGSVWSCWGLQLSYNRPLGRFRESVYYK